jgi:hypothetical protein
MKIQFFIGKEYGLNEENIMLLMKYDVGGQRFILIFSRVLFRCFLAHFLIRFKILDSCSMATS